MIEEAILLIEMRMVIGTGELAAGLGVDRSDVSNILATRYKMSDV
jgi:hypothetical protein